MKLLKIGHTGTSVTHLQNLLMYNGLLQSIDQPTGYFGSKTESAVMEFQSSKGLVSDGIVGPATWGRLEGSVSIPNKTLTPGLLETVATGLGVDINLLKAIDKIESHGGGFLKTGEIKVLYERHIFNRECKEQGLHLLRTLVQANHPDLCNTKPGGYIGGVAENIKLSSAKELNPEIAARSVSYGRYQLMGFRYKWCGFSSALQMESTLNEHEDEHLHALANFIEAQPDLLKAMQDLDFSKVASIYNGPKHQQYDVKLEREYNHFRQG